MDSGTRLTPALQMRLYHSRCPLITEAELRSMDPLLQEWTPTDEVLHNIYGDTIHNNNVTHLTGEIEGYNDTRWQRLHLQVISGKLSFYNLPDGCWIIKFLEIQTSLWRDGRLRNLQFREGTAFCCMYSA